MRKCLGIVPQGIEKREVFVAPVNESDPMSSDHVTAVVIFLTIESTEFTFPKNVLGGSFLRKVVKLSHYEFSLDKGGDDGLNLSEGDWRFLNLLNVVS